MESSLHRELKRSYTGPDGDVEARVGRYRIDVVRPGELIEIQQAGLGAIRGKVHQLLQGHHVRVVRPLVYRTWIVKVNRRGLPVTRPRLSPKRGQVLDLFHDWIHFTEVFPHPRLVVEIARVDIEEWRRPMRRRRWGRPGYQVADRKLVARLDTRELRRPADLIALLPHPDRLPSPFDTQQLARHLDVPRWEAQQIAYCLRRCGAARVVGKSGNALQYEFAVES